MTSTNAGRGLPAAASPEHLGALRGRAVWGRDVTRHGTMINTVLLLSGMGDRPATLDLGLVNLYTGVLEMMKLGAAASFLLPDRRSGGEAEILESETVPAGVLNPVEPVMISRKLWDGDKIILVSDGVLDAMPGAEKEQTFRDFLDGLPDAGVQETAEMILTFALSFEGEPRDDMTVLVGGIYG